MQDSAVDPDVRARRVGRLFVAGWAVVACGITCLIVVGFSGMLSLLYAPAFQLAVGILVLAIGVGMVAIAGVKRRRNAEDLREASAVAHLLSIVLVVAALVAGAALGVGTVSGVNAALLASAMADTTAPPVAKTPESRMTVTQAAEAYLEAAQRLECGYTGAHTSDHASTWCLDPRLVSFSNLSGPEDEAPPVADREQSCVTFDMTITGSSGGFEAGTHAWGFCFVRQNGVWMLWDQGMG